MTGQLKGAPFRKCRLPTPHLVILISPSFCLRRFPPPPLSCVFSSRWRALVPVLFCASAATTKCKAMLARLALKDGQKGACRGNVRAMVAQTEEKSNLGGQRIKAVERRSDQTDPCEASSNVAPKANGSRQSNEAPEHVYSCLPGRYPEPCAQHSRTAATSVTWSIYALYFSRRYARSLSRAR